MGKSLKLKNDNYWDKGGIFLKKPASGSTDPETLSDILDTTGATIKVKNAILSDEATTAIGDQDGNNIKNNYAASLSVSDLGSVLTLKNKNNTQLSQVIINNVDNATNATRAEKVPVQVTSGGTTTTVYPDIQPKLVTEQGGYISLTQQNDGTQLIKIAGESGSPFYPMTGGVIGGSVYPNGINYDLGDNSNNRWRNLYLQGGSEINIQNIGTFKFAGNNSGTPRYLAYTNRDVTQSANSGAANLDNYLQKSGNTQQDPLTGTLYTQTILPDQNVTPYTRDLGSSNNKFNNLYLNGTAYIGRLSTNYPDTYFSLATDMRPEADLVYSLGNTNTRFYDIYSQQGLFTSIYSDHLYPNTLSGNITLHTSLLSSQTQNYSYDIGNSTNKFRNLYLSGAINAGSLTTTGAINASNLQGELNCSSYSGRFDNSGIYTISDIPTTSKDYILYLQALLPDRSIRSVSFWLQHTYSSNRYGQTTDALYIINSNNTIECHYTLGSANSVTAYAVLIPINPVSE